MENFTKQELLILKKIDNSKSKTITLDYAAKVLDMSNYMALTILCDLVEKGYLQQVDQVFCRTSKEV